MAFFSYPGSVSAHSGGTDAYGGHNCYVGWCAGTYHYHNGGYVEEDYYGQGHEFGSTDALDNNHDYISSNAREEGMKTGYEVGVNGENEESYPDAPEWICQDISFDFRPNEFADYISGVYDGFVEECTNLANNEYSEAYAAAYSEGFSKYEESLKEDEASETDQGSSSSDNGGWLWILGIIGFYGAIAILGNWDELMKWMKKQF